MDRVNVSSSNLSSIGYDEVSSLLEVEFNSGLIYHYYDVPAHVHAELMSASSHGSYFSNSIRNSYKYAKA
jgi:hypothetical protein